MECLEGYTVEQVKEMSYEELRVLWDKFIKEEDILHMQRRFIEVINGDKK